MTEKKTLNNHATCPACKADITTLVRMSMDIYDVSSESMRIAVVYKCSDCSAVLKIVDPEE